MAVPHVVRKPRVNMTTGDAVDVSSWTEVDISALSEPVCAQFLARKRAINMYLDGLSAKYIRAETGLDIKQIYKIIFDRCLALDENGVPWGWRGVIPYFRIQSYKRKTPPILKEYGAGASGALSWVFGSPECIGLEDRFVKKILSQPKGMRGVRRNNLYLYKWLINELRSIGLEERNEWPFNAEKLGYVSILEYIKRTIKSNAKKALVIYGGSDAVKKGLAGDGADRPVFKLFDRVECDAHKLDARMVVRIPSPHGGFENRKINRIWIVVIIEVASRAILGYYLSMGRECSAEDVLRAVKRALILSPRKKGLVDLPINGALPSEHNSNFLGVCWNEFSVDGALANVCQKITSKIEGVVGAKILSPMHPGSFSVRRSKDDRPFIERFFELLAGRTFHRLSVTTGNDLHDKVRNNPEVKADELCFQLEFAEELLDAVIANYNATPHWGIGYRTPLEQMDLLYAQDPLRFRRADPIDVRSLCSVRKLCTLLGGEMSGRRPYFNFESARYSAEWIVLRLDLLGKKLWLSLEDEDDARLATVSTESGVILGVVRAAPPWNLSPHTIFIRSSIRRLAKRRMLYITNECDAVEEFIKFCERLENKKLPAHAAYLEARRVFREHADRMADYESEHKYGGKHALPPKNLNAETDNSSCRVKSSIVARSEPLTKSTVENKKRKENGAKAPVMRKAKIW